MKNKKVWIILFILIIIILICFYKFKNDYRKVRIDGYNFELIDSKKCDGEKLYYEGETRNVYLTCLDDIYLTKKNERYSLATYLSKNASDLNDIFDDLISNLKNKDSFWDGGTTIYTSKTGDLGIIMCHTVDGNRDIYIGKRNIEYKSDYCGRSEANEE